MSDITRSDLYAPLDRSRLYERVASRIETMIAASQLKLGDRLPSERELADSFGVSRTVIREALKLLEAHGLVEILTGNGVFVSAPDSRTVARSISRYLRLQSAVDGSALKIYELRRILEVEIAALAAERAKPEEVTQLHEILGQMAAELPPEEEAAIDLRFHLTLTQAANNEMITLVFEPIVEHLRRHFVSLWKGYDQPREVIHQQHRAIYEAVRDHASDRARRAMLAHLEYSREMIERQLKQQG